MASAAAGEAEAEAAAAREPAGKAMGKLAAGTLASWWFTKELQR